MPVSTPPLLPAAAALAGAGLGWLLPPAIHRLAVPAPARALALRRCCGGPFPAGPAGWAPGALACPHCGERAGPPVAPIVAVTAPAGLAAGCAVAARPGPQPALGSTLLLAALLLVAVAGVLLAAVDVAVLRLPDPVVAAAGTGLAALLALTALTGVETAAPARALAAAGVLGGAYALLALGPGGSLGFGDVKLAALLGGALGWLGWPQLLRGAVLAVLLGGLAALILLAAGRADRHTALPFGPALVGGYLLALLPVG